MKAGNWCVSEINNGGFLQRFWNSTGMLVFCRGFRLLLVRSCALRYRRRSRRPAMSIIALGYPRERFVPWMKIIVKVTPYSVYPDAQCLRIDRSSAAYAIIPMVSRRPPSSDSGSLSLGMRDRIHVAHRVAYGARRRTSNCSVGADRER